MPNIAGPITWSQHDEQCLRNLTARKAEFERRCRTPIVQYVLDNFDWRKASDPAVRENDSARVADWLIKNADTIRDLLQPFDSGERPPRASDEG